MRTRTVLGVILIFLALTVRQPALAQGKPNAGDELSSGISISSTACDRSAPEQPIPDDGHWLQVCLLDPLAPEASAVTNVAVKYLIEHPDPDQLEVRLSREDVGISQIMWERGKALAGTKFGKAEELDVFRGAPSQGQWYLWIRDAVPGQSGQLNDVSLVVDYVPTGTLPMLLSGEPGRPTSLRIPPRTVPSKTPDRDKQKSESQGFAPLSLGGWQEVKQETFEGLFPNAGWTLIDANPNDGKEYLWDDDDFRHHNGGWAGWPANGGANGLDPATKPYPPNMASWMTYGPFALNDAKTAESAFWLWRQIEAKFDYVFFGISSDGHTFNGYKWDGTANWEEKRYSLNSYLGDSSVWVAWLFVSDNTVQYEGPWVDDILIRKYVPRQVTAQGSFFYADRNNNTVPARFTKVYLYDQDPGGTDDLLATTTTDGNGFFQFPARMNWDDDDSNSDPNNRRLDLYVVWETDANDSLSARRRVTNTSNWVYQWASERRTNVPDGNANFFNYNVGSINQGAMWIFQDLRRAWETIYNNTSPHIDPGSVTAKWEKDVNCYNLICSSFFWGGAGGPFVFIRQDDLISADTVVHETGHHLMYNATGYWTWWDVSCYDHNIFSLEDVNCAWTEGWGDFLALAVNNDACFDWGMGPCGADGGDFANLEIRNRNDNPPPYPWGDAVEGRVAGALYDLWDNTNEPAYDSATFGLAPIAKIVLQGSAEERFSAFWVGWKASGQNKHHAARAIYQNTIDYDTAPRFDPPLPDRTALQGFGWENAIDLWVFSTDGESNDWELDWQIVYTSDWHCGVSIDAQGYIDIHPQPGWLGICDVTVRVSDTIKTADDTFRVNVVPVRGRVYLPIVVK